MTIYNQEILNEIFLQYKNKLEAENSDLNTYDYYIDSLRRETNREITFAENHHIVPKHAQGTDDKENIIKVSVSEHLIAHWIRWRVYEEPGDLKACAFRMGDPEAKAEAARLLIQKAREADRENKTGFFDPILQSERGKRGGPIGGSASTEKQFLARQQVGLKFGRTGGVKNQSEQLKKVLDQGSIWIYNFEDETAGSKNRTTFVYVTAKKAGADLIRALMRFVPGSIKEPSSFYKVLKGERKRLYGWERIQLFISSKADENFVLFFKNYPGALLQYEEEFLIENGME